MSTDFTKTTLEILKLAPRYLVSLGIVAALFLFLPDKTLKSFGVYDFVQSHRGYFFCVFVLTSVLFCVDRTIAVVAWMRHKILAGEFAERRL